MVVIVKKEKEFNAERDVWWCVEASGKKNADWVSLITPLCRVHEKWSIVAGLFYHRLYCLLEVKFDTGLEFLLCTVQGYS